MDNSNYDDEAYEAFEDDVNYDRCMLIPVSYVKKRTNMVDPNCVPLLNMYNGRINKLLGTQDSKIIRYRDLTEADLQSRIELLEEAIRVTSIHLEHVKLICGSHEDKQQASFKYQCKLADYINELNDLDAKLREYQKTYDDLYFVVELDIMFDPSDFLDSESEVKSELGYWFNNNEWMIDSSECSEFYGASGDSDE